VDLSCAKSYADSEYANDFGVGLVFEQLWAIICEVLAKSYMQKIVIYIFMRHIGMAGAIQPKLGTCM
jgi:hypothetical protein